ncbi:tellurite resistance TerB C-terminal domain-containing protein [Myroides odoratimimus]|uniref:tellurite resistance TerB C-terminal domain-containing protein n=1 Tax=Myroides odoratimimus TaxID=76832 RepID=UPI002DB7F4D9|nr:tellurite resistance TerB C-terminal domain-containing protein [Myroides odoratimimus]MEC4095400.1 tellurite resistance TerB C-terminal domain-containing protein [Myroides odoratimimus]
MKDKSVAALLAFFLGSLGIHKFYLNRPVQGVFYLLFCWTYIPAILGVIEAIRYILMSNDKFFHKYNSVYYNASSYITIADNKGMNLSESVTEKIDTINTEKKINTPQLLPPIVKEENQRIDVPYWGINYVYSYNDIKTANSDIRNFYNQFKDSFLNHKYIPLAENEMNYAFVLLFDFERDFINTNDYEKLKSNYNILVKHYPRTRVYCERKLQQYKNLKSNSTSEVIVTESMPIQKVSKEKVDLVPYWNSGYIYSTNAIGFARKEIQDFYLKFKQDFKSKSYIKLEQDNLGYAFTLMFDLEQEHQEDKDYLKLESYYRVLDELYPKVRRYTTSILKKYNSNTLSNNYGDLIQNNSYDSYTNYNEQDYYVGNSIKTKYDLTPKQVRYLNRIGFYHETVFNQAEFCFNQQGLVYCRVIDILEKYCKKNDTTLSARIDEVAALLKKHDSNPYYAQYYSDGPSLKSYKQEIYRYFFKLTENKVREFYNHKRKLNVDAIHTKSEIVELFEDLQRVFEEALEREILLCEPANLESEFVLNKQNTTRWKIAFEQIVKNIQNAVEFKKEIDQLAEFNKYNPSIENIYFDASKHIAKQDQLLALEYYLRYIQADLDSVTINNKPLNKTTLKVLFKNQQQLDQFNVILDNFLKTKDFERALKELQGIYEVKRKEIKLDFEKISDVKKQLNETVELLNEYLEDEDVESELDTSLLEQLATKPKQENLFNEELGYNTHEIELLQMIQNFNNEITRELVEEFASENGVFVDSLINNINEKTYELIDDNLIEEQEDTYIIEEQYYQNILK